MARTDLPTQPQITPSNANEQSAKSQKKWQKSDKLFHENVCKENPTTFAGHFTKDA
jgi:hypothetical protein